MRLKWGNVAAMLACLSLCTDAADATAGATGLVDWQRGIRIPLSDGVALHANLFRPPKQHGPLPCIVTLTPYGADSSHDRGMYFASHGYVFVVVDVRGRGDSEGEFQPLQAARDGSEVIEWVARQPYCSPRVSMWGGSYAGMVQWQTARRHPPHLASIVPVAAAMPGVDVPMPGNVVRLDSSMRWLTLVSGRTLQARAYSDDAFWRERFRAFARSGRPLTELDVFIGNPSPTFQEWISHPEMDSYWDARNPSRADYAGIDIPVLTITGQYDGDQAGALAHYRQHLAASRSRGKHFLVIGPWDHAQTRTPTAMVGGLKLGEASVLDMNELHRQWYEWTLKDGPRPAFLRKAVAWYVTGSERWRYSDSLDAVTQTSTPLYLVSNGGTANSVFGSGVLQAEVPARSQVDRYTYDPVADSAAEAEVDIDPADLREQRDILSNNGHMLIYHSAPFERDTELSGFFRLRAWLAIDQPDTDFSARVYEIAPDGTSLFLTGTVLRARYRESLRTARLVPIGAAVEYNFTGFSFVARRIAKGSRLRLVFGPPNSIYVQKNYGSGGTVSAESAVDGRRVTVTLLHDAKHPSSLYIPIGSINE